MQNAFARVLIIDDEEDFQFLIKSTLEEAKFYTKSVGNAMEGLHELLSNPYDLVLCDIEMPGMDGLQLLQSATARCNCVPFIIVTGYTDLSKAYKALRLGAFDFIEKPYKASDLIQVCHRAAEYYRRRYANEKVFPQQADESDLKQKMAALLRVVNSRNRG